MSDLSLRVENWRVSIPVLTRLQSRDFLINDALAIRDTMDISFFLAIVDGRP